MIDTKEIRELCDKANRALFEISESKLTDPSISVSIFNQLSNTMQRDLRQLVSLSSCIIPALLDELEAAKQEPNETLPCEGCMHHDPDSDWPDICAECKRMSRPDMYHLRKEGS